MKPSSNPTFFLPNLLTRPFYPYLSLKKQSPLQSREETVKVNTFLKPLSCFCKKKKRRDFEESRTQKSWNLYMISQKHFIIHLVIRRTFNLKKKQNLQKERVLILLSVTIKEEENKARSICGRGSEKKKMFVEATSL